MTRCPKCSKPYFEQLTGLYAPPTRRLDGSTNFCECRQKGETMKYLPRNDFVLIECQQLGIPKGQIALPDRSEGSKVNIVKAIGPDVTKLSVGDHVLIIGQVGLDVVPLPREQALLLTKQANIICIVREDHE